MPNVLDIRRRIRSVKNTRQITKAMKMVSAARLRRAQERALDSRPYAQILVNLLRSLVSRTDLYDSKTGEPLHPLLAERPEQNILLVVVTGDRGLAGAFNSNVLKAASKFIDHFPDKNISVAAVGRKGRDYLRRRYPFRNPDSTERAGRVEVVGEHLNLLGKLDYDEVSEIVQQLITSYIEEKIDSVYVIYNEFKSVIAQRLIAQRILPVQEIGRREVALSEEFTLEERERMGEAARTAGISLKETPQTEEEKKQTGGILSAEVDYIYEQTPEELFRAMLPRYVTLQLFQAMLESVAAEHAARMTAMDSATSNASKMIDSLTLTMNRARQAAITKEIIEIVSGAAAL